MKNDQITMIFPLHLLQQNGMFIRSSGTMTLCFKGLCDFRDDRPQVSWLSWSGIGRLLSWGFSCWEDNTCVNYRGSMNYNHTWTSKEESLSYYGCMAKSMKPWWYESIESEKIWYSWGGKIASFHLQFTVTNNLRMTAIHQESIM